MSSTSNPKDIRRAELWVEIISLVSNKLEKLGIDADKAAELAVETCDKVRSEFGGEMIYIPKDTSLDRALKHHEIYQRFNGRNYQELAKEYNITVPTLYRILKKVHSEKQPGFDFGNQDDDL